MSQPECGRCGGVEGDRPYDMKRANRGEKVHLTAYEDHEGVYYCSQKCLNIIIEGIDKRIKARKRILKERAIAREEHQRALQERSRIYACKIAANLPCPTANFANDKYPAVLALINHWKHEKTKKELAIKKAQEETKKTIKVTLMFGDIPSNHQVTPFGDNKDSNKPAPKQQPKEAITFGNAPTTTVHRTIWTTKTRYRTKLPIITFNGPNDWSFETGKDYDFEELHNADIIKVRLPQNWSEDTEEDFNPPIYDTETEDDYEPSKCQCHWATCDNDDCPVHEDQKIINNHRPKQVQFKTPQPSNDHPEVDANEAQRCHDEEASFQIGRAHV